MPVENTKLTVLSRIEPGCLGPEGEDKVDEFCVFAQKEFGSMEVDFVQWEISPRRDTSLSEIEYMMAGKRLSRDMVVRYLKRFGENHDEFELYLDDILTHLINQFLGY